MVATSLLAPMGGVRVRNKIDPSEDVTLTPSRVTDAQTLPLTNGDFPATAPAANPVFYRTYRSTPGVRAGQRWEPATSRVFVASASSPMRKLPCCSHAAEEALPSGRWLWIGYFWIEQRCRETAHPPIWWIGKPSV